MNKKDIAFVDEPDDIVIFENPIIDILKLYLEKVNVLSDRERETIMNIINENRDPKYKIKNTVPLNEVQRLLGGNLESKGS